MESPNVVSNNSVGSQTPVLSTQTSSGPVTVPTSTNVVTVPIPVIANDLATYTYVFVRGSLYANYSAVFGASEVENEALSKRFLCSSAGIENGIEIKTAPSKVINSLAQLGYRVVCSTGETEVVWSLEREL